MEGSPPPLFETSGDAIVTGDGPWYLAMLSDSTDIQGERADQGINLFTIVEHDGVLRISRHVYAA
jgi:hypothetical protein